MFTFTTTKLANTFFGAAAALMLAAPAAEAGYGPRGLYWLTSEIRGQVAEVQARADAILPYCGDDADDVRREIARLCRDLDKFERVLARGISCPSDLRRLCEIAERIEDHACELKDELHDAIEDIEYPRGHAFRGPGHFGRFAPPEPRVGHHVVGGRHYVGHRGTKGVSVTFGGKGARFTIGHHGYPVHQGFRPVVAPQPIVAGPSPHAVNQLVQCVDRLHYLTAQLHRSLRR